MAALVFSNAARAMKFVSAPLSRGKRRNQSQAWTRATWMKERLRRGLGFCVSCGTEGPMPRGDKSKYTEKQARKADHIAQSYEQRGVAEPEAERRAWATVNKDDGGGKKPGGSGRGAKTRA